MSIFTSIGTVLNNTVVKGKIFANEKGPTVLIAAGTIGLIGTTVWACKKTLIIEDIQKQHNNSMAMIENPDNAQLYPEYTEEDEKKDKAKVWLRTGGKLIKLYTGPIVLGIISVGGIALGTHKLNGKVVKLTGVVAGLTKTLYDYRERVKAKVGEEKENDLYLGTHKENVSTYKFAENSDDVVTSVKTEEDYVDAELVKNHPYLIEFGPTNWDGSRNWVFDENSPSYNALAIKSAIKNAQRDLEIETAQTGFGKYWLHQIYKTLGIKEPAWTITAGWVAEMTEDGKMRAPIGSCKIKLDILKAVTDPMTGEVKFRKANLEDICDRQDLYEEGEGIAMAEPIYILPNCLDIRDYAFQREKRNYAFRFKKAGAIA